MLKKVSSFVLDPSRPQRSRWGRAGFGRVGIGRVTYSYASSVNFVCGLAENLFEHPLGS